MAFWIRESDCEGKRINYICPNCGFDDGWNTYKFCPMCAEPLNDPEEADDGIRIRINILDFDDDYWEGEEK